MASALVTLARRRGARLAQLSLCLAVAGALAVGVWVRSAGGAKAEAASVPVTLALAGDVMLGRGVAGDLGGRWESALAGVRPVLSRADVAFANLESPLTSDGLPAGVHDLRAPPQAVEALRAAGVDVVSLTNNHALDAGVEGLNETAGILRRAGIGAVVRQGLVSSSEPVSSQREPAEMGLVAFDDSQVPLDVAAAARAVFEQAEGARPVIVSIHWGGEYQAEPSARQRVVAQALARAGASVIVGHGPHVVQPIAWVDDTLVAYSLGNLLFDQRYPVDCRWGAILQVRLEGREITDYTVIPTVTHRGRTQIARGDAARAILLRLDAAPFRARSTSPAMR
jgi:poly-gamma-glutamate synthesis protein (capsule biosynthesis protein)